jgi:hypothetical protein
MSWHIPVFPVPLNAYIRPSLTSGVHRIDIAALSIPQSPTVQLTFAQIPIFIHRVAPTEAVGSNFYLHPFIPGYG